MDTDWLHTSITSNLSRVAKHEKMLVLAMALLLWEDFWSELNAGVKAVKHKGSILWAVLEPEFTRGLIFAMIVNVDGQVNRHKATSNPRR